MESMPFFPSRRVLWCWAWGRRFPHTRWMLSHSATSPSLERGFGPASAWTWRTWASLCETNLMFLRTPSPSSDGMKTCKVSGGDQRQSSSLSSPDCLQREKVKVACDLEGFSWPHCCLALVSPDWNGSTWLSKSTCLVDGNFQGRKEGIRVPQPLSPWHLQLRLGRKFICEALGVYPEDWCSIPRTHINKSPYGGGIAFYSQCSGLGTADHQTWIPVNNMFSSALSSLQTDN